MTDQSSQFPRFYVTAESPCPYLPDLMERKVFTELNNDNPEGLHDSLTQVGFRRSQDIVYRPTCEGCSRCISVRIPVGEFTPSRTQKRILKANGDVKVSVLPNRVTDEQYGLLKRYLKARHPEGGMAEMSFAEYQDMVESSPINTHLVEYRLPSDDPHTKGQLIGVALTDELQDGLSMVYSFFEIDEAMTKRSLGTFAILSHIALAREHFLGYIYLGYWVKNSPKMAYKQNFTPLELLGPSGWTRKR
jgi:arginine-tRNA-protein transferase